MIRGPLVGPTTSPMTDPQAAPRTVVTSWVREPCIHMIAGSDVATFPLLPATRIPVSRDADGLPIGAQVIAAPFADHQAIAVAAMLARIQEDHR